MAQDHVMQFYIDYTSLAKATQGRGIKILQQKQPLQGLLILLGQVQLGFTSENLLNEIRQIVYSLYQAKPVSKEVCNNLLKSI